MDFLFVGNQLALDFLNTRPAVNGEFLELLPGWPSVAHWLRAAGLLFQVLPEGGEGAAVVEELRNFREELREAVLRLESGKPPVESTLRELNRLLASHPTVHELRLTGGRVERRAHFAPQTPRDAFAPIVEAAAILLADVDPSRVRKCENCVLHFLDTSKNGTRRWCSMRLCGNRTKVAAYAERHRSARIRFERFRAASRPPRGVE